MTMPSRSRSSTAIGDRGMPVVHPGRLLKRELAARPERQPAGARPRRTVGPDHRHPERAARDHRRHGGAAGPLLWQPAAVLARPAKPVRDRAGRARQGRRDRATRPPRRRGVTWCGSTSETSRAKPPQIACRPCEGMGCLRKAMPSLRPAGGPNGNGQATCRLIRRGGRSGRRCRGTASGARPRRGRR
jgi:hypothetical protein